MVVVVRGRRRVGGQKGCETFARTPAFWFVRTRAVSRYICTRARSGRHRRVLLLSPAAVPDWNKNAIFAGRYISVVFIGTLLARDIRHENVNKRSTGPETTQQQQRQRQSDQTRRRRDDGQPLRNNRIAGKTNSRVEHCSSRSARLIYRTIIKYIRLSPPPATGRSRVLCKRWVNISMCVYVCV